VVYQPPGPLSAIGQIGGPIIPGIFADITGDYRLGFTILAILAGLGSGFFLLAKKPKRPLKEG
jgi:MFS family permease